MRTYKEIKGLLIKKKDQETPDLDGKAQSGAGLPVRFPVGSPSATCFSGLESQNMPDRTIGQTIKDFKKELIKGA